jgi:hypothetical protein
MRISEMLSAARKGSKQDDIPGTVLEYTKEKCPACNEGLMKVYAPCCGSPKGYRGCRCGYKIQQT